MNTTKKQVGEVMSDYFKLINELPYDDFEIKVIDKIDVVYLLIKVDNYKDMGDYYSSVGREPNAIARIAKEMSNMFPFVFYPIVRRSFNSNQISE